MTIALTKSAIAKFKPCEQSWGRVSALIPAQRKITAQMARDAGCTFDDIVWIALAAARNDKAIERRLRHWTADCAARVLHIYERDYPTDARVRNAITAAHDYADGKIGAAARAAARDAARAAARDAARDAARAAARAAARDAARDAAWAAARDAAWAAARAAARDAARAAARDAARDAAWAAARDDARDAARDAAWDAEEQCQFDRLVAWLSDPEPMPIALAPMVEPAA